MKGFVEGPEGFASSSSHMQAYAARTLEFLRVIEDTVRSLVSDTAVTVLLVNEARATIDRLAQVELKSPIDPQGRIAELLEKSAASAGRIHAEAIQSRHAARIDAQLTREDGVVEAFTAFIAALADFHNVLEDMRDVIATLDASLQPGTGQSFGSADDLVRHLMSN